MSNPFGQGLLFYSQETQLDQLGRKQMRKMLDDYCWNHHPIPNYAIFGPKGAGKTTILERYFTTQRLHELALQKQNLVVLRSFNETDLKDNASIYKFFVETVFDSLNNLEEGAPEDFAQLSVTLEKKRSEYPEYDKNDEQGRRLLKECVAELHKKPFDYCLTLVIDNFHQLTNSSICAQATFQTLASLAQNRQISYIIATDLHMKIASDAFHISQFERIFNNTPIPIGPLKEKYVTGLILELLEEEDEDEPLLSGDDLKRLYAITGGIPGLMQRAAFELYQYRQEDQHELSEEEMIECCLPACSAGVMDGWVKGLPDHCWTALEMVAGHASDEDFETVEKEISDARNVLNQSGLAKKSYTKRTWSPICPLFEAYLAVEVPRQKERMEKLRREEEERLRREQEQAGEKTVIYNITGDLVQGDKNEQNVHQTLNVNGLSTTELLNLLDNGQMLAARLQETFGAREIPLLDIPKEATEEELVQIYDETADKVGAAILAEEAPTEEEEKTLDSRFLAVRDRTRPEVTDQLLELLSPKCQFYLKVAVVVEDALAVLTDFHLGDFSAQLVMYGKVLEQQLRDSFYELFHKDTGLRHWDTKLRQENPGGRDTFAMTELQKAMIGGFTYMLEQKGDYLSDLCIKYRSCFAPGSKHSKRELQGWKQWWWNLSRDVDQARIYRNYPPHAGSETPESMLGAMCGLLFGSAGILKRCQVGRQLYTAFALEMRADNVSYAEGKALEGQRVTFTCQQVTGSGGLKGVLTDYGYRATVSAKKVGDYVPADLLETSVEATVISFDFENNRTFRLSLK